MEARIAQDQVKGQLEGKTYFSYFPPHYSQAVCFHKIAYLRQQVVVEVQGKWRFLQGLMPGSAVLFHNHRLNFR